MTDQHETLSFEQLLGEAQLPEDTVDVCMRGDLVAAYHGLQEQLAAMPEVPAGGGSLAGDTSRRDLIQQMEAVAAQMRRSTQTFRLRALSTRAYTEFLRQHPPRPDDRRDMVAGFNRETMGVALLRLCVVEPVISPQQWEKLADVLSTGEWAKLDRAAQALNFAEVNVPFSPAASPNQQSSGSE